MSREVSGGGVRVGAGEADLVADGTEGGVNVGEAGEQAARVATTTKAIAAHVRRVVVAAGVMMRAAFTG